VHGFDVRLLKILLLLWATVLPGAALADDAASGPGNAVSTYRALASVRLDPNRVFRVRDLSIETHEIHLTFNDGVIAFTQPVNGVITGAYFQGDAEVLVLPPDRVERESLALFTGNAVLEEKFTTGFFRFNGGEMAALPERLKMPVSATEFFSSGDLVTQSLAPADALALLNILFNQSPQQESTFLHARLRGAHLGNFDVTFDPVQSEQISIGRSSPEADRFYDVWTRFASRHAPPPLDSIILTDYKIVSHLTPPSDLDAEVTMQMTPRVEGVRCVVFELSRYLKIKSVMSNGAPLEFIQNESLEGTELARRGNDVAVVVFPAPLPVNKNTEVKFGYAGPVMSDAGNGLVYVGARGTWYPNRGPAMANFDMTFSYPGGWLLVASGHEYRPATVTDTRYALSYWRTERPVPVAGFNLGRYQKVATKADAIDVAVYAAKGIENLAAPEAPGVKVKKAQPRRGLAPDPLRNMNKVAADAGADIESLQKRLGTFPFSALAITQMPGQISQGWPGLIFLSSYAFLPEEERPYANGGSYEQLLYGRLMLAHEIAHQWWGDRVMWTGGRDVWLVEALANYSALQCLEEKHPNDLKTALDSYQASLLRKDAKGKVLSDAGPVTLGFRLSSTKFPTGYEEIAYGRGTWLIHMLREMLREPASKDPDAGFNAAMQELITTLDGKQMSNHDVQAAFEKHLPADLRYESKNSLDWFFEGWVNGTAVPSFSLKSVQASARKNKVVFTGKIIESDAPEQLVTSLPIYAESPNPEVAPVYLGRVFADESETTFTISAPAGTRKLLLDPYRTVLRR
jgi:hypothetical protein